MNGPSTEENCKNPNPPTMGLLNPLQNAQSRQSKSESALNFAFLSFLGFTILQFVFAVAARSDAMLADCAAMTVDAITYLFNYGAERMKHRLQHETSDGEQNVESNLQCRKNDANRELQRLLLELIPPSISATTLMVVTILTMLQSIHIILSDAPKEIPPDITIMLVFSALNLVLDGFNVLEFARVDHVVLSVTNVHHEHSRHFHHHCHSNGHGPSDFGPPTESSGLLDNRDVESYDDVSVCSAESDLNLNMCSAWTHIAADTLRSIAVLVAASFSALFPQLLSPVDADSLGAILVSIIILMSLFPLFQGIYNTAWEIRTLVIRKRTL
ncbi:cation efflux family protein [Nitzschia inconspicua]|uniref:Cation efflux family protein n=1 Tax=Nitzschia inconspicua TaxID=303405 RepID=A0A9K3L4P8_9STRA|nr:cation efflux family protein [Nitzschia inconspicua]